MSPQSRGRALISETEQGKKNSVRTSPKLSTTFDMWSIFSLSPIFWVFTLIFPAPSVTLFLSASQICGKGDFFPDWTMFLHPFTGLFLGIHSSFCPDFISVSLQDAMNSSFTESEARKLWCLRKKKMKNKRPGQPEPGQQAACRLNYFSSQFLFPCGTSEAVLPPAASGNISPYMEPHE